MVYIDQEKQWHLIISRIITCVTYFIQHTEGSYSGLFGVLSIVECDLSFNAER